MTTFEKMFRCCTMLVFGAAIFSTTGCEHVLQRAQSPDAFKIPIRQKSDEVTDSTHYISDSCDIYGLNYASIEGIGIAVELSGTGSNPKPGGQRDYLKRELESESVDLNIENLLANSDTELVLLKGLVPPGAQKGDRFDIEIGTLPKTEATSLDGGIVLKTDLKPMEKLGKTVKLGHVNALGKGHILVDGIFETRNDRPNQLHGYILGGGVVLENRNLGLSVKKSFAESDDFTPKTTTLISRAINGRFTRADRTGRHGVAEPKTDRLLELAIPPSHRHNIGRYLKVIINIAHSESAAQRLVRMERLGEEMLDPNQAEVASLRLEALGSDGIPILKRALGTDNLEVKFQAAQALAYMGETDGIDHLRFVAETESAFRWHAITALAALDDPDAKAALNDLMHVASAETRYGAFRALRKQSKNNPMIAGEWLRDFHLHRIPSQTSEPMLHFARRDRPEIVVFGDQQTVSDDFIFVQSGTTIRSIGNGTVSISLYSPDGKQTKTCSNRVSDLVQTLAGIGFGYGDLLKMFRAAKNSDTLQSRLAVDAIPRLGRSYIPNHPDNDSLRPGAELTGTTGNSEDSNGPGSHADPALPKTTTLGKMKQWLHKD